jgi:hypothetical protein
MAAPFASAATADYATPTKQELGASVHDLRESSIFWNR